MNKRYFSEGSRGQLIKETVDEIPQCGKDTCDSCCDCLACYGSDRCHANDSGQHVWVEYISEKPHADSVP